MGRACVALARGDAAARWNPARLPYQDSRSVTVAHGDVIEDFSSGLTTISTAFHWGGEPTDEYGMGTSARWAVGAFVSYFGLDEVAGSAGWSETAVSGVVSRTMWEFAAVGVAMRYLNVSSDIEDGGADGYSADLAISLDTTDRTRAALVVRNVLSSLEWSGGRDEMIQAAVDLAFSYTYGTYGAAEIGFCLDTDGVATASAGAEARLADGALLLWGGLRRINDDSPRHIPSMGVGVPVRGVVVGYGASFDSEDALGTTQRFSVSAAF